MTTIEVEIERKLQEREREREREREKKETSSDRNAMLIIIISSTVTLYPATTSLTQPAKSDNARIKIQNIPSSHSLLQL